MLVVWKVKGSKTIRRGKQDMQFSSLSSYAPPAGNVYGRYWNPAENMAIQAEGRSTESYARQTPTDEDAVEQTRMQVYAQTQTGTHEQKHGHAPWC